MSPSPSMTDDIIGSFLKCQYKAYLKLHRAAEEPSEYQQLGLMQLGRLHLDLLTADQRRCDRSSS